MPKEWAPPLGIRLCGLGFTFTRSVFPFSFYWCFCYFSRTPFCFALVLVFTVGLTIDYTSSESFRWRPFRYRQHLLMRFHSSFGTGNETNQKRGTVRQHYCIFEVFVELSHGSSLLSAGEHPVLILLLRMLLCWFTVNLTVLSICC